MTRPFYILFFLLFSGLVTSAQSEKEQPELLLQKGWEALVHDDDTTAIKYFELAYEQALKNNDAENTGSALLNLGLCYYGVSSSKGLQYCFNAMAEYKKLEPSDPKKALKGRSRCLQLLSTIYSRQGKYTEAIHVSREALAGFPVNDSSGYRGLIFTSLAKAYEHFGARDSAGYYHRKALAEQSAAGNFVYLPAAYANVADLELEENNIQYSRQLYRRGLKIADSTGNTQAQVISLLGMGRWYRKLEKNDSAEMSFGQAKKIASGLKDRAFYLKVLEQFLSFKKENGDYKEGMLYQEEISAARDSMNVYDNIKLAKSLEVQFDVAEKDRKLTLLQKENDIARLHNYLLWASVAFILLLSVCIIIFLRKTNARNKVLLQTKEALVTALGEQNKMREQYLQNELEYKESQLSVMALQIMQKNDLMQEIQEKIGEDEQIRENQDFKKVISKGLNHDKEWADFNTYFESINKNFYSRLREAYPDISQNDLKICALIKLNLSIKEMAGILNISPDSVKTARYRLRKKLQLNTEDNLGEFISKLS